MISPTMGKSKCLYELSGMPYLYDLDKPGTYGIPDQILQDTSMQLFSTEETRAVSGEMRCMESLTIIKCPLNVTLIQCAGNRFVSQNESY